MIVIKYSKILKIIVNTGGISHDFHEKIKFQISIHKAQLFQKIL